MKKARLRVFASSWILLLFMLNSFKMDATHKINNGIYLFVIDGEIELEKNHASTRDALVVYDTNEFKFNCLQKSDILIIEVPMTI